MGVISVVNGDYNQLTTWGLPPCRENIGTDWGYTRVMAQRTVINGFISSYITLVIGVISPFINGKGHSCRIFCGFKVIHDLYNPAMNQTWINKQLVISAAWEPKGWVRKWVSSGMSLALVGRTEMDAWNYIYIHIHPFTTSTIYNLLFQFNCMSCKIIPKKGNVIDKKTNQRQNGRCKPSLCSMHICLKSGKFIYLL